MLVDSFSKLTLERLKERYLADESDQNPEKMLQIKSFVAFF